MRRGRDDDNLESERVGEGSEQSGGLSTDPLMYTLRGHGAAVRAVAVTPDGKRAVSGSEDAKLKVWDLERGEEIATLGGHSAPVYSVAITSDGRYVVSGSEDAKLKVWDLEHRTKRVTLSGHAGIVWSVVITPDGRRAISGSSDGTLKVWDLERRQEIRTLRHGGSVWAVAVTPDGARVVSGARDGTVKLWSLASGSELATFTGYRGGIRAVNIVPRKNEPVFWQRWLAWEPDFAEQFTILLSGDRARAVTPDGKHMVLAGDMLTVWDLEQDRIRAIRTRQTGAVWAVTVTPDGRRAVLGAQDRTLRVWDLERVPESPVALAEDRRGSTETLSPLEEDPPPLAFYPEFPLSAESLPKPLIKKARLRRVRKAPAAASPAPTWDEVLPEPPRLHARGVAASRAATRAEEVRASSEPVRLGASAPRKVRPGQEFTARLAAYDLALLRQARRALRQPGARTHANLAGTRWKLGVKVRVTLAGAHLSVEPAAQEFVWEGEIHVVHFDVHVASDIEEDTDTRLKFNVFLVDVPDCEAVPVARLRLDLGIRPRRNWLGWLFPTRVQFVARPAFETAFASYDIADRANVLTRLDALRQHTGMQIFHECLSLDPSTWRQSFVELMILQRDLFLLFWSRNAAASSHVEWEWRTALEYKGLEAMQAQRLEPEPLLPPELESLGTIGQNLPAFLSAPGSSSAPEKRTILFLAANIAHSEGRALDEEARDIAAKIRAAEHRDALKFQTRWAVRPDDLLQSLNEDRPAVVHFSSHGSGEGGILLPDEQGVARLVTAEALKRLFTALKDGIRLVVLNACYSHAQALAVAEVIDCVVGMSDRIRGHEARVFAASFYRGLGFGRSVQNAFDQGLAALALAGLQAEHVPVLHVRDGVDASRVHIVAGGALAP